MPSLIWGEDPPKITRKVLQRNRLPNDYKASVLLLSQLSIKQPPRSSKTQLAQPVQRHWTYPGEDWKMDFTQMPVSKGYKYLLVMIDTFTGWIKGFPTWTEKAKKVVQKTCSIKSFWDLAWWWILYSKEIRLRASMRRRYRVRGQRTRDWKMASWELRQERRESQRWGLSVHLHNQNALHAI